MKFKKNFILSLFTVLSLFLYSCGYTPIYSSNKSLFKVNNITYENNKYNRWVAKSIKSISNDQAQKVIDLEINTIRKKKTVAKNSSGDPEIFELIIDVEVTIDDKKKLFVQSQKYNNSANKFDLRKYEIEIEKQMVDKIINELILYLTQD